jgi:hypothetical protein
LLLYPIGDSDQHAFTGVFDGQGHVLRNVSVNQPYSTAVGLFGALGQGGEIRNLASTTYPSRTEPCWGAGGAHRRRRAGQLPHDRHDYRHRQQL